MKIYAIEYRYKNGSIFTSYYKCKKLRDYLYEYEKENAEKYQQTVKKIDFEEIKNDN